MASRQFVSVALAAVLAITGASQAGAWGATGHRYVGVLAIEALPAEVPAFLRGKKAAEAIGELARDPDRTKGSGKLHDSDREGAHFVDIDDNGLLLGVMPFTELPPTRADYEKRLQAGGENSWSAGYLQYAIIDGYAQLVTDLGLWRVLVAAEKRAKGPRKAWLKADRIRREQVIMRDLGYLAHFVGDATQPLHTSVHYNGWGDYPNPQGYTTEKMHSGIDGHPARAAIPLATVRAKMSAFTECRCPIEKRTIDFILASNRQVEPLYILWKADGFRTGDERGVAFTSARLAAGASELRDLIVLAWRDSAKTRVGWPAVSVSDVEAGTVDPYESLMGKD